MKYLIILALLILYTFIVFKATFHYYYNIKDHIIYGQVIPYQYMNDGDLARVKLHWGEDNIIDSVTLESINPNFDMYIQAGVGHSHIDLVKMQVMLKDKGKWIQFKSYKELGDFISHPAAYSGY